MTTGRYHLYRGADNSKDQTYFLFSLTQQQLSRAAFPVGHLDKDTVRAHAQRLNLHVTSKPDSQEICFVPDGDYAKFVERQAPDAARAGTVVDHDGRVLGTHARRASLHDRPAQGPRPVDEASRSTCSRSSRTPRRSWSARATRWAARS